MPRWTIYSRAQCGLCDEMFAELAELIGADAAARVTVIDVDHDPSLQQKYGQRVPVLFADDEFVCAYRLDPERVRVYLAAGG